MFVRMLKTTSIETSNVCSDVKDRIVLVDSTTLNLQATMFYRKKQRSSEKEKTKGVEVCVRRRELR
jgi:adenosyl cobinamide kinase/adenosyl cobinamide phosphate guanylyltransferase